MEKTRGGSPTARRVLLGVALAVVAGPWLLDHAGAQSGRRPGRAGGPAGQPAAPAPFVLRDLTTRRDWTLRNEVRLHGFQYRVRTNQALVPTSSIDISQAAVVYPIIGETSMSRPREDRFSGKVKTDSITHDDAPVILEDFQGPTKLAVWEVGGISSKNFRLEVELSMASYEVDIDEDRARAVGWPENEYPPEVALNLQPQLFVRPDGPAVQRLVNEWTGGNPRGARPYDAAKFLAGKVVEHFQPSGTGFESTGRGSQRVVINAVLVSGFEVNGSESAAVLGKGTTHDMACLLCAVYRAAGIPARLVIALDQKETTELQAQYPVIRAFVEFYLWDEKGDFGQWVPVDIVKQRQFSNRPPPLHRKWEYFGKNRDFEFVLPFSHHWHPPAAVTNAGPPAIWGWYPTNGNPAADTNLHFFVRAMSKTSEDTAKEREERRNAGRRTP